MTAILFVSTPFSIYFQFSCLYVCQSCIYENHSSFLLFLPFGFDYYDCDYSYIWNTVVIGLIMMLHTTVILVYAFTILGIVHDALPGHSVEAFSLTMADSQGFGRKEKYVALHADSQSNAQQPILQNIPYPCNSSLNSSGHHVSRRDIFDQVRQRAAATAGIVTAVSSSREPWAAQAAVTDATDVFADNFWSSETIPTENRPTGSMASTDEVTIQVRKTELKNSKGLGLELADIEFKTNIRVFVKSVTPGSYGQRLGIQPNWIAVRLNDTGLERTNSKGVAQYLSRAIQDTTSDTIAFTFRDPAKFREGLATLNSGGDTTGSITTQVAPAGDTTQRNKNGSVRAGASVTTAAEDQRLTVTQLSPPRVPCKNGGAQTDDLLEISYVGTVVDTGYIFDGSAVLIDGKGIPGRGNDVTAYFVLGKQPFGQFPPGWDVGLNSMCIGERRRLLIPPALGYGATGVPRRNVPPNATLQYDVTLVSINGLSI